MYNETGGLVNSTVKLRKSMSIFQGISWKVTLLPEWIGKHDEECSTIYHPNGVGALQISSYSKNCDVTDSDLRDLAHEHIESGAKLAEADSGEFRGFTLAFGVDGEFWQYWYIANGSIALLVTYNCNEADLGPERDQVKKIVASLQAT